MSLILALSPILLISILLITSLSRSIVTNYNWLLSSSSMLVSSREVEAPSIIVGAAFGSILSTIYRNRSSNYITKPYRNTTLDL